MPIQRSAADIALETLEGLWPGWRIWYVRIYQPPSLVWCALADIERHELPMRTMNADSPEALAVMMAHRAQWLADRWMGLHSV